MSTMRDALLGFIAELRAAGVRISVAESMDAMRAVAAAGLTRTRMREALAATLIKDEADRVVFDEAYMRYFGGARPGRGAPHRSKQARAGVHGAGGADDAGASSAPPARKNDAARGTRPAPRQPLAGDSAPSGAEAPPEATRESAASAADSLVDEAEPRPAGLEAGHSTRMRAAERVPFSQYSDLEYEAAHQALAVLKRRFRVRLSRRLRLAKVGRIDFRRTIRAAIQHGGAFADLRFRSRRQRHIDLVVLADVSGSVRYAASLMLELVAGARECFHKVRSFVYVDRMADADFERGHLVMAPPLDLYAKSDFGRVLSQLWERRSTLLNRATVLVILGDGRNNRRPSRADLLRDIGRICRAVIWLNPEDSARWGTGDSAIAQYGRAVDALLPSRNLLELEHNLSRVT